MAHGRVRGTSLGGDRRSYRPLGARRAPAHQRARLDGLATPALASTTMKPVWLLDSLVLAQDASPYDATSVALLKPIGATKIPVSLVAAT